MSVASALWGVSLRFPIEVLASRLILYIHYFWPCKGKNACNFSCRVAQWEWEWADQIALLELIVESNDLPLYLVPNPHTEARNESIFKEVISLWEFPSISSSRVTSPRSSLKETWRYIKAYKKCNSSLYISYESVSLRKINPLKHDCKNLKKWPLLVISKKKPNPLQKYRCPKK